MVKGSFTTVKVPRVTAPIEARFWFALIGQNLTAQTTESHSCAGGGILISEKSLQALALFPPPAPCPLRACSQVRPYKNTGRFLILITQILPEHKL